MEASITQKPVQPNDNTTAVHSVNNMDSCKSLLWDSEVRKIWDWTIMRNSFIMAAHTTSIMYFETDAESRTSQRMIAWKLRESYFNSIFSHVRSNPWLICFTDKYPTSQIYLISTRSKCWDFQKFKVSRLSTSTLKSSLQYDNTYFSSITLKFDLKPS